MNTDDLRIRRWGSIGDGYLGPAFHMRFKPGHVLYGSRRTYLRKVAVADFEGITANTTFVLESKDPTVLLPELLSFIMQAESFHAHSIKQSKGSVNPYVNFSDLTWYEFALPPLEEQRRIASVLGRCDHLTVALDDLRQSHELATASSLEWLLGKYAAAPVAIGKVALRVTNGFVGSAVKHYVSDGVPYLRSLNVRRSGISFDDLVQVSESFHRSTSKSRLREGDLLTVQSGHVGETAVVPARCEDWNCHALILTRLDHARALPQYVATFLNSLAGQRRLSQLYVGSTVAHLNTSDLARMEIPLPDIATQRRIVRLQEGITTALDAILVRQAQADALRKRVGTHLLERGATGKAP